MSLWYKFRKKTDSGKESKLLRSFYTFIVKKKIAILINANDHRLQTQIEIDGKLWFVELLEDSISTLTIE